MGRLIQLVIANLLPSLAKKLASDEPSSEANSINKLSEAVKGVSKSKSIPSSSKRADNGNLGPIIQTAASVGSQLLQASAYLPKGGQKNRSYFTSIGAVPKFGSMLKGLTTDSQGIPHIAKAGGTSGAVLSDMFGEASRVAKESKSNMMKMAFDPRPSAKLNAAFKQLALGVELAATFPVKVVSWGDAILKSTEAIKDFSPALSRVHALSEVRRIKRGMASGERIGGSVESMVEAIDDLKDEIQPYLDTITRVTSQILTRVASFTTSGIKFFEDWGPIASPLLAALIRWITDDDDDDRGRIANFAEFAERIRRERGGDAEF